MSTPIIFNYARSFQRIDSRKYIHLAQVLGNGQRSACVSKDTTDGTWYVTAGWKKVDRSKRLATDEVEYAEHALSASAPYTPN